MKIIAGNWKMNKTEVETKQFITELIPLVKDFKKSKVIICTPFTDLKEAKKMTKGTNIIIGAQNMHYESKGAYTGEISADMLKEIGIKYVIIGHSERRKYFNETDETVNLKVRAALNNKLIPIICVGETLEQREDGIEFQIIFEQVLSAISYLSIEEIKKVIIAYEPIWAIGTGKTASVKDVAEITEFISSIIYQRCNVHVKILYGGSVKPSNSKELFGIKYISGGLIGGASLNPIEFAKICDY